MQSENIMNQNNALHQTFRGQMREPMAQINFGLEDDLFSAQHDPLLGKNDFDNLSKPQHGFMDEAAHPLGLKNFDTDLSRQLNIVPGQADYTKVHQQSSSNLMPSGAYSKENDSNLAPVFRQCDNFNERPEHSSAYCPRTQSGRQHS